MPRSIIVTSDITQRLNLQIKKIKFKSKSGIRKATLLVKRESLKRTPINTGNLRGSAYSLIEDRIIGGPRGEIGYTASYAPYVHEINKNYRKAGTSWKFLEKALKDNRKRILELIKGEVKI